MGKQVRPVVLERRWDVSSLLGEMFRLFFRHAALFVPLTLIVAVPYVVGTDLIWGEEMTGDELHLEAFAIPSVLGATVVPALITALHIVSVLRLAEGERPSVGQAIALAGDRAGPAILTTLLYCLAVAVGLVLLILPGIWLSVRLYLAPQAAVVEGLGPVDALRRSAELTRNRWWQTFGRFLLMSIVVGLCAIPLGIPMGFLDFGVAYVVLDLIAQTIVLSLSALFGTLVFMDYRGFAPEAERPAAPAGHGGFEPPQPPPPTFN